MVAAEEVVLSSDGERSDRILDSVVVDVISAVKDITAQAWEKRVSVDQSLSIRSVISSLIAISVITADPLMTIKVSYSTITVKLHSIT